MPRGGGRKAEGVSAQQDPCLAVESGLGVHPSSPVSPFSPCCHEHGHLWLLSHPTSPQSQGTGSFGCHWELQREFYWWLLLLNGKVCISDPGTRRPGIRTMRYAHEAPLTFRSPCAVKRLRGKLCPAKLPNKSGEEHQREKPGGGLQPFTGSLPGLHPAWPPSTSTHRGLHPCRARHPGRRPVLALGLPAAVRLGKGLCRGHPHPLRVPVLYQLPPKRKSPLPRALLLSPGA